MHHGFRRCFLSVMYHHACIKSQLLSSDERSYSICTAHCLILLIQCAGLLRYIITKTVYTTQLTIEYEVSYVRLSSDSVAIAVACWNYTAIIIV